MPFIGGAVFLVQGFLPMADQYNLRLLCQNLFDHSKRLAFFALMLRMLSFATGSTFVLLALNFPQLPLVIALISLVAEIIQWRSDAVKNSSESLLRNLEFQESLGWPISNSMLSDTLATIPGWIKKTIKDKKPEKEYFASQHEKPLLKALENLQESAWWSKHLASRVGFIYLVVTAVIVLVSFAILFVSIETVHSFALLQNIARVVTSTIMLLFSLKFIRLTADYFNFSKKAEQIESRTEHLFKTKKLNEMQVVRLFYEYQLSRAYSPLIPTWVWKSMNAELNELWIAYRATTK